MRNWFCGILHLEIRSTYTDTMKRGLIFSRAAWDSWNSGKILDWFRTSPEFCLHPLYSGKSRGQRIWAICVSDAGAVRATIPGQIPGPWRNGKANALASGSETSGTYTKMNERQDPTNGTLPCFNSDVRLLSAYEGSDCIFGQGVKGGRTKFCPICSPGCHLRPLDRL